MMKILCIDDETNVLKSLKRLFQLEGYEILTASSAQQGLKMLTDEDSISLVISDYLMPRSNGVSILRDVHRNWPDAGRILLTGYTDHPEVNRAVAEGVVQKLIEKPWQEDELLAIVNQWLGPPTSGTFPNLPA